MGGSYNKNGRRKDPQNKVFNGKFHNTIPVGRPRNRWADVIQRGALQVLGIRGWRRRAENRGEWRYFLGRRRRERGCSAIHGGVDGWMDYLFKRLLSFIYLAAK